jgi:hypothetical protein
MLTELGVTVKVGRVVVIEVVRGIGEDFVVFGTVGES